MTNEQKLLVAAVAVAAIYFSKDNAVTLLAASKVDYSKISDDWRENEKLFSPLIAAVEKQYGIPTGVLHKMMKTESSFTKFNITSPKPNSAGALGIAQIVPRWHPNVNPLDPIAAIKYAGKYLKSLYKMRGNWREAVAAYNWGIGNLQTYGIAKAPKETRDYLVKVFS